MSKVTLDIVGWLAEEYAGPVATRALWSWAGGDADDIGHFDTPLQQWQALWQKAEGGLGADAGESVSVDSLLREMIADHPAELRLQTFLQDRIKP